MDFEMKLACLVTLLVSLRMAAGVAVEPRSDMMTIEISKEQMKNIGETAELRCLVKNVHNVSVNWFKVQEGNHTLEIAHDSTFVIRHMRMTIQFVRLENSVLSILRIRNIQSSDAGDYGCLVRSNRAMRPAISTSMRLLVKSSLIVRARIVGPITLGQPLTLECYVEGTPKPSLTWVRSENKVLPRKAIVQENFLKISQLKEDDFGRYFCEADNGSGAVVRLGIDVEL